MGVIQSLRSQATAVRAQEDTKLQISGYLGTVNKGLGGQLDQLIEGLQNAINERTKAYNGITYKLTQQVSGKGGIGEQGVQLAFTLVKLIQGIASYTSRATAGTSNDSEQTPSKEATNNQTHGATEENVVKTYEAIYDYISYPIYKGLNESLNNILTGGTSAQSAADKTAEVAQSTENVAIATLLLDTLTTLTKSAALALTIDSLKYDYQRMTTQLGFTDFMIDLGYYKGPGILPNISISTYNSNPGMYDALGYTLGSEGTVSDQGASKLLAMRDSIMMRYKIRDTAPVLPGNLDNKGYVGSLKRRF